ncbi:diguanylate cyclase (plasmid) [Pseudoalteromonas xiamenensis]|nr:diguanylate cyclase [Pseudoalteromonas xiamenensis]WMN62130.1 diguanylate cyclase [Pseudoalteromonas xiamenensis]
MLVSNTQANLEKKLTQAIQARKSLEEARKAQVETLTQFAMRLSVGCKGLDVSLDNQLAKFRSALTKGVDFEHLMPMIDQISGLLKQQEASFVTSERDLVNSILSAGKQLQKTKGLPDDSRRNLRHLLDHEIGNVKALRDFIPLMEKLVDLYHQALQAKLKAAGSDGSSSDTEQYAELARDLLALSNELMFDEDVSDEVKAVKNGIALTDSADKLLDASVAIIRIVVKSIARERQTAQGFLISLNQTLEELNQSIVQTSEQSKSVNSALQTLNSQIESKIKNLSNATQSATSIVELKALVDGELKSLSKDLVERERLEQLEKSALIASFEFINERVNQLESKVNNYKKRLTEQRFRSLLDGLTKLPNRAAFDDKYNQEFHNYSTTKSDVTLVVIDVDHFKSINDKYGHSAGDKTLQVIARALKMSIRKSDFIARYGGEEFVLLMPGMPLEEANGPLEKIRKTIKSIPFKFKDKEVEITISLGATQLKEGDTPLTAFDRADDALYEAKNSGRDRVCLRQ